MGTNCETPNCIMHLTTPSALGDNLVMVTVLGFILEDTRIYEIDQDSLSSM
jgi:hypothetical protein